MDNKTMYCLNMKKVATSKIHISSKTIRNHNVLFFQLYV